MNKTKQTHNILVTGTRTYKNTKELEELLNKHITQLYLNGVKHENITFLSGTTPGADRLCEQYAQTHGYKIQKYPANWNKHGNTAGVLHSIEMVKDCHYAFIFYNGYSKGTGHIIKLLNKHNKPYTLALYHDDKTPTTLYGYGTNQTIIDETTTSKEATE